MDDARAIVVASPWHKGEREMQRRAGAEERMAVVGPRHIRDHLTPQHQEFFPMLPFVIVGAVDPEGDAWATMLSGRPGFLGVPDPRTLHVAAAGAASDPAALGLEDGDAVGLLGIQLETRRRNRLNGIVRKREAGGFDVAVEHSFGNCDKYITVRQHSFARDPAAVVEIRTLQSKALDGRMTRMIREADTLFVASYLDREDGRRQVDVSHRGGEAGFVRVRGDGTIEIPDFAGNSFFNTLGNILENPKCGLLVVDFETGDLLHLSGEGEVVFDGPEISGFEGAKRFWRFRTREAVLQIHASPLRFTS